MRNLDASSERSTPRSAGGAQLGVGFHVTGTDTRIGGRAAGGLDVRRVVCSWAIVAALRERGSGTVPKGDRRGHARA